MEHRRSFFRKFMFGVTAGTISPSILVKAENLKFTTEFKNGRLYINNQCINIEDLEWHEHATFKGVFLKHIIKGIETKNQLSCHLVKINPNCEISNHNHIGKYELHEIIEGNGFCLLNDEKLNYQKGVIGLIPADMDHSVKANEEGLLLFAKFFPALL